jgi:hypothetical protein
MIACSDMFEDMNEINDLMSRSYGTPDGIDEVKHRLHVLVIVFVEVVVVAFVI